MDSAATLSASLGRMGFGNGADEVDPVTMVVGLRPLIIFVDRELDENNNVRIFNIVGSKQPVKIYSLDAIISVGYRVNSKAATRFRQWATQTLNDVTDGACATARQI